MHIERWDYASSLNGDRMKKLQAAPAFEDITAKIKNDMEVLCFHFDHCKDNDPFKRPVYCILVEKDLFDWFFNSENGYRAAYYQSPYDGLRANDSFIQSLMPELLASDKTIPNTHKEFIEESLKSPSAKAWLVEYKELKNPDEKPCNICKEWTPPQNDKAEILNNRWEYAVEPNYGRKAPCLTMIRIIGAFLNDHYDEFIPSSKRFRAKEIHDMGWT